MSPLALAEFQRGISKSPLRSPGPQPRKVASPQNLSTKRSIDGPTTSLLLRGGMIVTQDAGRSLVSGDVLVEDGRIAAVGRGDRYAAEVIDCNGCAWLTSRMSRLH